jgi:hypothetical protein
MKDNNVFAGHIAGFTYYDGLEVIKELELGTHLSLAAEPDNNFDSFAVIIYYKETKLGYLPQHNNKLISQLLQHGYTEIFDVRINRITLDANPEGQIGIIVRIKEKIVNIIY